MPFLLALLLALIPQSPPPPDTEIYLASLSVRGGELTIGTPSNISNDHHTLVLYVLGHPATLQPADTTTGKAEAIASGVGRSIQRVPDGTVSFVKREGVAGSAASPPALMVHALDPRTRQTRIPVAAPAGAAEADTVWTPDGLLLVAYGSTLYGWRSGDPAFKPMAELAALDLHGVTRLSVSPQGDRIALVAQPR